MEKKESIDLGPKVIVTQIYASGISGETVTQHLNLDLLETIEEQMEKSGEFYIPGNPDKYKSIDGILFIGGKHELIVPWKQYVEWEKPAHINAESTTRYSPK